MAYYSKKELTNMGVEGFVIKEQEFHGGGRRGRKHLPPPPPNYGGSAHATFMVTTSRPLPPPLPPAGPTSVVAINHYATASSSGHSRSWRHQHGGYNYHRYSPAESRVCWTDPPVVTVTTETTTTVVHGGYDAHMLMDDFIKY
nr:uncharacterized protein LOC109176262 [Ipomoea trifida]